MTSEDTDLSPAVTTGEVVPGALRDYLSLTKPGLVTMVLVTTLVGFYLGSSGHPDYRLLSLTLIGAGLAAGGALALNQYLERDLDARMERTQGRPLPSGRLLPGEALVFGLGLAAAGLLVLALGVNMLSAAVTAATQIVYLLGYTPLKRRTSLCSVVGAVSGALPPVTGWVAAHGALAPGACVLFSILFLWQLPHSLAIARMYRDDYARAGFRLLPVVDQRRMTERQIASNCAALLVVGLLPTIFGMAGSVYFVFAFVLGVGFLACGLRLVFAPSASAARHVLFASLVYLPLLLSVMAADKLPL